MKFFTELLPVITGCSIALVQLLPAMAASSVNIGRIAESITVKIEFSTGSSGSGVLISRKGNIFSVLTCKHVVASNSSFAIVTSDGKRHSAQPRAIKLVNRQLDLAVVEFSSSNSYAIATSGDSAQIRAGEIVYIAGFPKRTGVRQDSFFLFNEGKINSNNSTALKNGYALVYNVSTLPGMSGGPVLDSQGNLVGIHGQGDQADDVTVLLQSSDVNPNIVVKSGFNYGIPINIFRKHATSMGISLAEPKPIIKPIVPTTTKVPRQRAIRRPNVTKRESNPGDRFAAFLNRTRVSQPQQKPIPIKTIKTVLSPQQLMAERSANMVAFEQKYHGTVLHIQGKVSAIYSLGTKASLFMIDHRSNDLFNGMKSVICEFENPSEIIDLREGDVVTVRGLFIKEKIPLMYPRIGNCTLLNKS
jgi:S1-C subfamily serine protease